MEYFIEAMADRLPTVSPFNIFLNIFIGAIALVLGLTLLRKADKTRQQKIWGISCIVISILGFLGSIINWGMYYFLF